MGNRPPQVSVIIPAYNQAQYLKDAIQSVLAQTYRDLEIIVIDDGSNDDTPQIAGQFKDSIHYVHQDNQGLAGARNTGIRCAYGNFIALLDSDDQWLPDYLEKMTGLATRSPEAAVYYCQVRCMDADGHDLQQILGGPVKPPVMMYQSLLRANFLIPSTILMRRSIMMEAGLFDQSLRSCEDWDLWLRLLPKYSFIGTNDCLVRYRLHGSSLSANLEGMHKAARATIEKNFGDENGRLMDWSSGKRRAFAGLYRYQTLTFVQRQNNWQAASSNLLHALQIDPILAKDIDLFYDLAMGSQPLGYRGTPHLLDLKNNAIQISEMLTEIFKDSAFASQKSLRHHTFGTAYFALGLVAYNTGQISLARKFLLSAIKNRPELILNSLVMGDVTKSFINQSMREKIKGFHFIRISKSRKIVDGSK